MKKVKKLTTFRLSDETRQQLKLMAECENMSEGEIIEWAINKFYNLEFRKEKSNLPDIKIKSYSL
jgi:predicted transcriptional regulator